MEEESGKMGYLIMSRVAKIVVTGVLLMIINMMLLGFVAWRNRSAFLRQQAMLGVIAGHTDPANVLGWAERFDRIERLCRECICDSEMGDLK